MTRRLPRYVSEFTNRHGKPHVRFRRKGQESYYFKSAPWTPEFMREYQDCLDRKAAPDVEPGAGRTRPGSFDALIAAYYRSNDFARLRPSTRKTYRNIIERFRAEFGSVPVTDLQRRHVKDLMGEKAATPSAANNFLDRLRGLMVFALDIGMRADDPTLRIKPYKIENDGWHTWTDAEIAKFAAFHPIGTKARLALALMLFTGQRRSDAVVMGWQHVKCGKIAVRQIKTNERVLIPMHPELVEVLAQAPRDNMTFITTRDGKPYDAASFGNWFKDRCVEAGVPVCSPHGLRKAAARRMIDAGCDPLEAAAITGHRNINMLARYAADANKARLAERAMSKTYGMEGEQKLSNLSGELDSSNCK